MNGCPLCDDAGGRCVYRSDRLRVVHAQEPGYPAFYRVVWNAHVAEFSDLSAGDRVHCMEAVVQVERALRECLAPTKINLAALGNMVPHLHWHVIARFDDDDRFPAPVWAAPVRGRSTATEERIAALSGELESRIVEALGARSL